MVRGSSLSGHWADSLGMVGCGVGGVVMGLEERTELRPVIEVYLTGLADGSDEKVEGKRKG